MFRINPTVMAPEYLALLLRSEEFTEICRRASRGTTNRKRLREDLLLSEKIPVPPEAVQQQLLEFAAKVSAVAHTGRQAVEMADVIERDICNLMLLI
jgi:restriction endonuclease S subunit